MSSKLSQFYTKQKRQREGLQHIRALENLQEALADGSLSDEQIEIDTAQAASVDQAAALVKDVHAARQLDSDATELREVEIQAETLRDAVDTVNKNGGFSLESLQWAMRATRAVFARTGLSTALPMPAMESFDNGGKVQLSLESIDALTNAVSTARGDVEAGSVDALVRVFATLAETMPAVKDRLTALKQVLPDTEYDETVEITLDDTVFQALAVNGAMPPALKDYFVAYALFANKILAGYSENALDSAAKAAELAEELTGSRSNDVIGALTEALIKIGDPRRGLSADELAFVLPGSGPLFGGKNAGDELAEDSIAKEGPAGELQVRLKQFVANNMPLDPLAYSERPSLEAVEGDFEDDDEDKEEEPPVHPDEPPVEETPAAPAAEPAADAPAPEAPAGDAPPVAAEEATPADDTTAATDAATDASTDGSDPLTDPEAPAASEEAAPVTTPDGSPVEPTPPEPGQVKDETSAVAPEAPSLNPAEGVSEVDGELGASEPGVTDGAGELALGDDPSQQLAPMDPSAPSEPAPATLPTMRVLSKDTIAAVIDELTKCFEIVDLNSFAEARQSTWVGARSAYGKVQKSLMDLSPAQVAELRQLMPSLADYLDATFTLSAWPAVHLLTNMVFTANAFLLLAERSIAGRTEETVPTEEAADPGVTDPVDPDAPVDEEEPALPEVAEAGTDEPETPAVEPVDPTKPAATPAI